MHVQYSTCVDQCLHIKFSTTNLSGRSQQNHSIRAMEKEPFTVKRREKVQSEQLDSISHFVHSRLKRWLSICSETSTKIYPRSQIPDPKKFYNTKCEVTVCTYLNSRIVQLTQYWTLTETFNSIEDTYFLIQISDGGYNANSCPFRQCTCKDNRCRSNNFLLNYRDLAFFVHQSCTATILHSSRPYTQCII